MSLHTSKPEDEEFARLAYASVAGVETVEENDRNRLGYHVWLYLRGEVDSLTEAITLARSRFKPRTTTIETVEQIIRAALPESSLR